MLLLVLTTFIRTLETQRVYWAIHKSAKLRLRGKTDICYWSSRQNFKKPEDSIFFFALKDSISIQKINFNSTEIGLRLRGLKLSHFCLWANQKSSGSMRFCCRVSLGSPTMTKNLILAFCDSKLHFESN